jgi:RNA polymerase sigma-70 factor, ECF subfamily
MNRPPTAALALASLPGNADQRSDAGRRLRALFRENFDLVGRVIRNLGVPPTDIDDVLERVFSSAAARLSDIAEGSERAFLVQAAVRWSANARRARARIREIGCDELPEVPDLAASPEELTEGRRAATILDDLLATMPVDLRAVFVLDEIEEMSRSEIAAVLDIPEGTVASRLRKAREDFQSKLARWKTRTAAPGGIR